MIYVVGKLPTQSNDVWVIDSVALWLIDHGHDELGERLLVGAYDEFDMSNMPERGDVLDHLRPGVELVVALHLNGVDKIPSDRHFGDDFYYNRQNGHLLRDCLRVGAMLAAWGDQPWLADSPFEMSEIRDRLRLYSRKERT